MSMPAMVAPDSRIQNTWSVEQVHSIDAFLAKFAKVLPGWSRQNIAQPTASAHTMQEPPLEVYAFRQEITSRTRDLSHTLSRIMATVTVRVRRQAQRGTKRHVNAATTPPPDLRRYRSPSRRANATSKSYLHCDHFNENHICRSVDLSVRMKH